MFCSNCGTKLSDNARFCSSCGQKVEPLATSQPSADDFLGSLTPEQQNGLMNDLARAVFAPVDEEVNRLEEIAKYGQVTTDDVKSAVSLDESHRKLQSTKEPRPSRLQPYVLAQMIEIRLRQLWYTREGTNPKTRRKSLENDWYLYVKEGMRGLIRTHVSDNEAVMDHILNELKGLGEWLEDETVKNLMLALRLDNVQVTQDSAALAALKLGDKRFSQVADYVANMMKGVKK